MTSILIKDTTREERQQIVDDAIGNISASCDGCAEGIIEMYQAYIDGEMELREVNAAFNARYVPARGRGTAQLLRARVVIVRKGIPLG